MARGPLFLLRFPTTFPTALTTLKSPRLDTRSLSWGSVIGGFRCAPCLKSPWQRPPSALLHLAAQLMQAMVPPLVQGCWGLASEPWSAVRSHRKRCMSLRRRRSITRRLHLFTSRRLSTSRPSTLDRGITVVHIEVIGASATFGFPFKDAILPGPQKKFPVRRLGNSSSSLLWF